MDPKLIEIDSLTLTSSHPSTDTLLEVDFDADETMIAVSPMHAAVTNAFSVAHVPVASNSAGDCTIAFFNSTMLCGIAEPPKILAQGVTRPLQGPVDWLTVSGAQSFNTDDGWAQRKDDVPCVVNPDVEWDA